MTSTQIKYLLEKCNEPVIFKQFINDWYILKWSLCDWGNNLNNCVLKFRKGCFQQSEQPVWENSCEQIEMTMKDFISFQSNNSNNSWVYFDYKYMFEWLADNKNILNAVSWGKFGYPDKSGDDSTIWIGSKGAHTPCHMDTYGCNLVAQIYGRKEWILFPPEEDLKPTRVPYEESSVYSKYNFFNPNLNAMKGISNARLIILNPGDVLYLPPNWWHYVENLETAISINIWLPTENDDYKRVEEAVVQLLVSQITKDLSSKDQKEIINPNCKEVPGMGISSVLEQVSKSMQSCHTKKSVKKSKNGSENKSIIKININDILKDNDNIMIVPKLSHEELRILLEAKNKRFQNTEIVETKEELCHNENLVLIEKIMNSICHPEVLNLIAQKLINDN